MQFVLNGLIKFSALALLPWMVDGAFINQEIKNSGAPIEALETWDIGSDTGFTNNDSVQNIVRGICEKYDYYVVWMSTENYITQVRILASDYNMEWDGQKYVFKDAIYFSFNSGSTYINIYYVHGSHQQTEWQKNYSNVQKRGLPCYPQVSNESNKILNGGFRLLLFFVLFSICRAAVWVALFNKQA